MVATALGFGAMSAGDRGMTAGASPVKSRLVPICNDTGTTNFGQPLDLYHSATSPFSKSWAATLGLDLAFSATWRGLRAPARTLLPGNGLTGTSQRTVIVTGSPPLESTRSLPCSGLLLARSLALRTLTDSLVSWVNSNSFS